MDEREYDFLIVDDSAIMRQTVMDYCEDLCHTAKAVSSGKDAIDLISRRKFDLVFLDIHMPEMNGLETLEAILAIRPEQKVVLMTTDRDTDMFGKAAAPEVPASGFINKPFTMDVFSLCIKTVLGLKGRFTHRKEGYH